MPSQRPVCRATLAVKRPACQEASIMQAQPRLAQLQRRAPPAVAPMPAPAAVPDYQEPPAEEWTYDEAKILWLEVPESIAPDARLGVVHTVYGPLFILRVRGEDNPDAEREVKG